MTSGNKRGSSLRAKRELIWGTLCSLRGEGALQFCRVDAASLGAVPLK